MFRRIVSNLAFSPALVGQLGFYARRLKKEETTRRVGLVFTALALSVQALTVFDPPEAANAATPGQVGNAPRCTVEAVGPRGSAFTITKDGQAVVEFDVRGGKDCKVQLSANSFFAPTMNGRPYSKQILHDRETRIYGKTGRYSMKTELPKTSNKNKGCFYQVDLTYGTYNVTPVLAYGHGKLNCGNVSIGSYGCTSLNAVRISDTRYTLKGRASVANASIDRYVFSVTKPNGQKEQRVVRTKSTTASIDYTAKDPGDYDARLTVYTSIGSDTRNSCTDSFKVEGPPTPTATCSNVSVTISNRTQAYFKGSAAASGGAKIKSYTFIVKDSKGKEVKRTVVQSSATQARSSAVDLPKAGSYTVQLVVGTSLGNQTNRTSCVKPFTVSPEKTCPYNPSLPINSPDCQPCPDDPDIWIKDEDCSAEVINTKTATNMTRENVEASTVTARADDKISYTISMQNVGKAPQNVTMEEDLSDVLEYASLIDQGGGEFNKETKTLTWPAVTLKPTEKQTRTIVVQMMKEIPATNTGTAEKTSYDCKMSNTYGNTIDINVDCPPQKVIVEQVVKELPTTGPRENMLFAGIVLAVVVFFYARSRQLGREVRLIRRDLNTATL